MKKPKSMNVFQMNTFLYKIWSVIFDNKIRGVNNGWPKKNDQWATRTPTKLNQKQNYSIINAW